MNGQRRRLTARRHAARLQLPVTWPTRSRSLAVAADSARQKDIGWREQGGRLIDMQPGSAQARTELAYVTAE
jgi:hypothetical protein